MDEVMFSHELQILGVPRHDKVISRVERGDGSGNGRIEGAQVL